MLMDNADSPRQYWIRHAWTYSYARFKMEIQSALKLGDRKLKSKTQQLILLNRQYVIFS